MKLVVITPIGPGHEVYAERAAASVRIAADPPFHIGFGRVEHVFIDDRDGGLGRSAARNQGMLHEADWFFFLDADDRMRPDALAKCDFYAQATFGAIALDGTPTKKNIFPCGWREIALYGAAGTLSMGFFCRADVARRLRFNEEMDAGEDFDFYMRLDEFTKIGTPLVDIGYDLPSAGGPRGYDSLDWIGICNKVIADYVSREPWKYDLGHHAVLAKATRARGWPGDVS